MQFYDKVLKSKSNNNIHEKHIGMQYQPAISNNPITTNSAPITLKPLSDVEGLQRAYARTNGVYIRNNTMFVAGTKDFPHDHWDDVSKLPCQTTNNSLRYINADKALKQNDGVLRLNDNSHPEEIKSVMKMSKKTFKKAIGSLYKQKLIDINNEGIQLV